MKTAIVVRHIPFEDLGSFEPLLREAGYLVFYKEAPIETLDPEELFESDLLISLGGPISANDTEDFEFLEIELEVLHRRMVADKPTLGICLGAQLMAKAMGGTVGVGRAKEIGWSPLKLTEDGKRSPLQFLDSSLTQVLHWHGEVFSLPEGAVNLASTPACDSQAFSYGKNSLALQFHAEVNPAQLEKWYVGHTLELSINKVSVSSLRAKAQIHGKTLLPAARAFFSYWLESLDYKLANLSQADTRALQIPGSKAECPASGTRINSASGHSR